MNATISLSTLDHTVAFATALARALRPGDAVMLCGDLGVGKTTIVERVARTLGYEGNVSSPTFTLAHHYEGVEPSILHVDAYRLSGPAEFLDMGLDFHGDDVATLVEWGDRVDRLFPDALTVTLTFDDADGRVAAIEAPTSSWADRLALLTDAVRANV